MENVIGQGKTSQVSWFALTVAVITLAFAAIVVAYGMDAIIMGAHDVFHDFRHAIGMPCH